MQVITRVLALQIAFPKELPCHVLLHARERFVEEVVKKLPMLERLVVSRGYFDISSEVMRALLEHCPRLELLDAAGCYNNSPLGYRLRQRCQSTIKNQRMPRWRPDSCGCCIKRTQQYADEHDY